MIIEPCHGVLPMKLPLCVATKASQRTLDHLLHIWLVVRISPILQNNRGMQAAPYTWFARSILGMLSAGGAEHADAISATRLVILALQRRSSGKIDKIC